MCVTCKPIRHYEIVNTTEQLNKIKESAFELVNQGTFTLLNDFSSDSQDYHEMQFLCEDCGKVHVLWLHTFLCRTGGEWRSVTHAH